MPRIILALVLCCLAANTPAETLADAIRACADAESARTGRDSAAVPLPFDGKRGSHKTLAGAPDAGRMKAEAEAGIEAGTEAGTEADSGSAADGLSKRASGLALASDCPQATALLPDPVADGMGLAERRLSPEAWREVAATLEGAKAAGMGPTVVTDVSAVIAALAPAPLDSVNLRPLWRERLNAWVGRQFRRLFGPDTPIGRWLRDLGPDDLSSFGEGVLIVVLVLLTLLLALCGVLLYRFVSRRRGRRRVRVDVPAALADVPLLELDQIRTLPERGQALALMRLVLARIEEAGLCRTSSAMTNSEIAQLLAKEAGVRIDRLAALADRCLFGGQSARAEDLPPCFAELAALEARVA